MNILRNLLLTFGLSSAFGAYASGFTSVSADEFETAIADSTVQIVDARRPDEFAAGHIQGAININVQSADFDIQAAELKKEQTVAVYCRSGKRSKMAAVKLENLGFTKIVELNTGIIGWQQAGKQIVK